MDTNKCTRNDDRKENVFPPISSVCTTRGEPGSTLHTLADQRVVEVTGEMPCTSRVGGRPEVSSSSWPR